MSQQTHAFRAEVSEVLKLVIHSLYSHKEIFLRELISNASDALDKLRFKAITDKELLGDDPTLEIRIHLDKEAKTLRIEDTGIGMTEAELVEGLGTIAHSGSRRFLEQMAASATSNDGKKDLNLIGQFGVGFYSAYLVADRVEVVTRGAGAEAPAFRWASEAKDSFTLEPAEKAKRGTEITLHLKGGEEEYLDPWAIKELVTRYSDYVAYPIKLDGEQINQAKAPWQRPKGEITDEQYEELYKHLTHDFEPPLARTHFRVEGGQDLVGLLYIPKHPPFDLHDPRRPRGVRLFVKRVFVMDDCEEIVPQWLRFVRGLVDSDDLPLNGSRELLQDSRVLEAIRKQVTKKTLDLLAEIAKDRPEDYLTFWKAFGGVLKEGLALGDPEHKTRLAELLRFESSKSAGEAGKDAPVVSLAEYFARMPLKQPAIYYLQGESRRALEGSPYLEALHAHGYEVLFMTDAVDAWAAEGLGEYQGKKLVSAMRADLKIEEPDAAKKEESSKIEASLKPLCERVQKVLAAKVKEVKLSERLVDSPACLSLGVGATPPMIEKILRERGKAPPAPKRVFEINPKHALIQCLGKMARSTPEQPRLDEWIELLYEQALLTEGAAVEDPNRFARQVASLLTEVARMAAGT